MIQGIIGKKLGMTQAFKDNGEAEIVTVIDASPCTVTQVKTETKEGYNSVQLGFGAAKRLKSPQRGQMRGFGQFKYLREIRVDDIKNIEPGAKVDVSLFKAGDMVDITGVSKSKGFAGVVKRHHFAGGPKTHGQSDRERAPGSIGPDIPNRVMKGMRMAGRMGGEQATVRHLEVFKADLEHNLLLIKGAVPGGRSGLLLVRKSSKRK